MKLYIKEITCCNECPHYKRSGNIHDVCWLNGMDIIYPNKIPKDCPLEDVEKND